MDIEAAFDSVRKDISEGRVGIARDGVLEIAEASDDPFDLDQVPVVDESRR